jgi:hypothetical protein
MTTAQDVSEKLIALDHWLSEARRELERELDRELDNHTPATPAEIVRRDWCMRLVGQLEMLRHAAGYALSTVEVAYDLSFSAPEVNHREHQ